MKILSGATAVAAGAAFRVGSGYRYMTRPVQVSLVGTSGSVRLQGRSDPTAPWVDLGTAFTASGMQMIGLMPEVRANVTAISAAAIDMWVDAQDA